MSAFICMLFVCMSRPYVRTGTGRLDDDEYVCIKEYLGA